MSRPTCCSREKPVGSKEDFEQTNNNTKSKKKNDKMLDTMLGAC